MAVIYYPKNQLLYIRDTVVSASNYESVVLACSPNTVLYFDTSSAVTAASAMNLAVTASWALSASFSVISTVSASYSSTASFALNGGGGEGAVAYMTIATSSLNWITCSFLNGEQYITIGVSGSYNFTCSDIPSSGQVSNAILYINNTATSTSSLVFPATWKFIGIVPTYLTASKVAVMSLKSYGDGTVLASMTSQY